VILSASPPYYIGALVAWLLLGLQLATAQSAAWTLDRTDVSITAYSGALRGPEFADFHPNSRNPSLLAPSSTPTLPLQPRHESVGIQFRFRFHRTNTPNREHWIGFGRSESNIDLYRLMDSPDTLLFRSQTQFLDLSGGSTRIYRHDKRVSFRAGGHLRIGLSTGSRLFQGDDRLFANPGPAFGVGGVLGIRVRLLSNLDVSFEQHPTAWRHNIDGSTFRGLSRGTVLGIEWRL
jgi:hypothetical protein